MSSEEHSEECPELQLSQETMNQVMSAVGVDGNSMSQIFQTEVDEDEEESSGSSSLSISRMIFKASSVLPPWGHFSQSSGFESQSQGGLASSSTACSSNHQPSITQPISHGPPGSPLSPYHNSPSPLGPNSTSSHCKYEDNSPLISSANPTLPPPLPGYPLSQGSQFACALPSMDVDSTQSIRTNIPSNVPLEGEYGFKLILDTQERKSVSKNANFTYSPLIKRAYIKRDTVIPFNFNVKCVPPSHCIIRAMCIHKAPEMIGQNLICCPKHVDSQKKKGALFPYHFVRPQAEDSDSLFCEDRWKRLSVTTSFAQLQKKPGNVYTALYLFPCFTSDYSKNGQLIQVIFTLECDSEVLGRAVLDIRVCSTTGRDRGVDERKVEKNRGSGEDGGAQPPSTRRGRKRAAAAAPSSSNQADLLQCTMPPQKVCRLSSQKVHHTIYTYPELIPFIEVCVRMMEQVNGVAVDVGTPAAAEQEPQQPAFSTLESWLEHLELSRYLKMLHIHGVSQVFQLSGITEDELKQWGMRNTQHRKKFLEGVHLVVASDGPTTVNGREQQDMEVSGSPPLFSSQSSPPTQPPPSHPLPSQPQSSQPHASQGSQLSTQTFSSSFEVVQIQVRKRLEFEQ